MSLTIEKTGFCNRMTEIQPTPVKMMPELSALAAANGVSVKNMETTFTIGINVLDQPFIFYKVEPEDKIVKCGENMFVLRTPRNCHGYYIEVETNEAYPAPRLCLSTKGEDTGYLTYQRFYHQPLTHTKRWYFFGCVPMPPFNDCIRVSLSNNTGVEGTATIHKECVTDTKSIGMFSSEPTFPRIACDDHYTILSKDGVARVVPLDAPVTTPSLVPRVLKDIASVVASMPVRHTNCDCN